jgi:sirohydrochlorin cobaltochelatase
MQRVRERIRADAPDLTVELAFLEFIAPTLETAVDTLVGQGVSRIRIVPVFLAQGGHLKRDIPALLEAARTRHPGCEFTLARAVGEDAGVIAAIADFARQPVPAPLA